MQLDDVCWQERYNANEVFTIQCEISDKPDMPGKLNTAIGSTGAHIVNTTIVELTENTKTLDIVVFASSKEQVENAENEINAAEGMKVIGICDEVMEIHRRGAIDIVSRVPIESLTDLRMIYTPGVASVCKVIEKTPEAAYEYTGICDRIAIVTDGTAVLGLGDIGPLASLPVMEGKAAIFAEFANLSAVPVLIDSKDPDKIIETTALIALSYGAIQLEDIAAPACFVIEEKLQEILDIPVLHDDQHGTATVVLAALINALKITNRKPQDSTVLMLGAGAAGIAISKMLLDFGIKDIVIYDSTGPIYKGRTERMNPYKTQIAEITNKEGITCPLAEGFKGKDIFIGVAQPNMVSKEMIASMAPNPIAFPLSNPVGEITTQEAAQAGAAVTADGRSLNNAQAYPGLFRGALDARAKEISMEMMIAAATTLAKLAELPDLLPDMLDRGIHQQVAEAVAKAAK